MRNRVNRRIVLLAMIVAVAISSVSVQAGTIRSDQPDQAYLGLGAAAAYAGVGRLDFSTSAGSYVGSGTLIAPDWVLTAGHVVDKAQSMTFTVNGTQYVGSNWLANPGWNGNLLSGYDLGLVHLTTPVAGVAPAKRYTDKKEAGKVGTAVGFGMTGTGLTGATYYDGQKRAGQNMIDAYYGGSSASARLFLSDFDNPLSRLAAMQDNQLGDRNALNLEYLIAPGDSGGGVFINGLLAGVNSFISAKDGKVDADYGDISGHVRVSVFNDWIDSVIARLDANLPAMKTNASASASLASMTPVPEPATLTLLGLGALALIRRRK